MNFFWKGNNQGDLLKQTAAITDRFYGDGQKTFPQNSPFLVNQNGCRRIL